MTTETEVDEKALTDLASEIDILIEIISGEHTSQFEYIPYESQFVLWKGPHGEDNPDLEVVIAVYPETMPARDLRRVAIRDFVNYGYELEYGPD